MKLSDKQNYGLFHYCVLLGYKGSVVPPSFKFEVSS